MTHSRSLLLHGLSLLLKRLPAVLWTWFFSVVIAVLFALPLHTRASALLDHSLGSASLTRGFDLTTMAGVLVRLTQNVPGGSPFSFAGAPVFLVLYFVLVPGALFCYLSGERARLSTLLRQGLLHFWRFVRITVVAAIAFGLVLGPFSALNTRWGTFVDDRVVGRPGFLLSTAGTLALFLVASLIRLYFDLVEVYTVQLGLTLRPNGRPDRRVRRAFGPAWRALRHHLARAWGGFLLLSLLGFAGYLLLARTAVHTLAQPRVWPLLLFSQLAILLSIVTRFWQRGAEATLALDHPIVAPLAERAAVPGAGFVGTPRPVAPPPAPVVPVVAEPVATAPMVAAAPVIPASPVLVSDPVLPAGRFAPVTSPATPATPAVPVTPAAAVSPATPVGPGPGYASPVVAVPPGPPADLQTSPIAPVSETRVTPAEPPAPVHTVYDIDPFTPMPHPPNPISTEEEESLRDRSRRREGDL